MRSKTLLVSNIFATIYSAALLWIFGGAIIEAGGVDYIKAISAYFKLMFELSDMGSPTVNTLYVIVILLCVHIITFVLGCLIGWIAYAGRKSGGAKFAATLYLIGTICFLVYFMFGLPITILGFIGGGNQKKINNTAHRFISDSL